MKLLIVRRFTCRIGVGLSTYGWPMKGDPIWHRVNGVRFATRRSVFFLTFREHELTQQGRFVTDMRKRVTA